MLYYQHIYLNYTQSCTDFMEADVPPPDLLRENAPQEQQQQDLPAAAASMVMVPVPPPEERNLMRNVDGTSCFMDALLVALFMPVELQALDALLFEPAKEGEPPARTHVRRILRAVSGVVRGTAWCSSFNTLRAALCVGPNGGKFCMGQQDPAEFFQYLLGGASLFHTKVVDTKSYSDRTEVETRNEPQSFESLSHGAVSDLSAVFPVVEADDVPANEYGLLSKSVRTEFMHGDTLVFTREKVPGSAAPLCYGELDPATRAYVITVKSGSGADVRMRLCSIIVWKGVAILGGAETCGHYAAYVYMSDQRQWLFFDDAHPSGRAQLVPALDTPETWPHTQRYVYGKLSTTGKCAVHDKSTRTMMVFETEEAQAAHRAKFSRDMSSVWCPSTHGVLFIYSREPL